jgi:lipid-A-disaccharide synthase
MRYYIIAGEASGDLHGSNLMKELMAADSEARFRYFGGDLMKSVGGELVKHYREMAFMGIVNVIRNLRTIRKNLEFCKEDILQFQPDVLILIDYPGFNLRVAEFAKQHQLKVFYYISPKLWAWKEYRVKKIRKFVDEMFTIFPFETEFYKKHGIDVHYVGNPLMDSLKTFREKALNEADFRTRNKLGEKPMVALLAGSRVQEIKRTLPLMVRIAATFPDFQFVVAGLRSVKKELYNRILKDSGVHLIYDQTYELLNNAHTALVASGTAALETALVSVPQTVIYKVEGGWIVDFIFRNFIFKMAGVSLPNIIMDREIVKEYIQKKMTFSNVKSEMQKLLFDDEYREGILSDYERLIETMGQPGCSKRAAQKMTGLLTVNNHRKH